MGLSRRLTMLTITLYFPKGYLLSVLTNIPCLFYYYAKLYKYLIWKLLFWSSLIWRNVLRQGLIIKVTFHTIFTWIREPCRRRDPSWIAVLKTMTLLRSLYLSVGLLPCLTNLTYLGILPFRKAPAGHNEKLIYLMSYMCKNKWKWLEKGNLGTEICLRE